MTTKYIGNYSVGATLPILLVLKLSLSGLSLALQAAIAAILPELIAKLDGYGKLSFKLGIKPPTIAGNLELAAKILASMQAAATLSPPSVSASAILSGIGVKIAAVIALKELLEAKLTLATDALNMVLEIDSITGAAGIHIVTGVQETEGDLGAAIQSAIDQSGISSGTPVRAWLIVTEEANVVAVEALEKVLKSAA
jgi:hypothetical protein